MAQSSNIPQGYKDSPLGIIPENWEVKRLEEICDNIISGSNKEKLASGLYPVFGSTGIIGYSNKYVYDHPLILVARVGANAGLINKSFGKYDVSDNTLMICPNELYNFNFAYNQLLEYNINRLVFGSGQPLVTAGQLKKIMLSLPPLPEQQKIAAILSTWDEAIEKQTAIIEKLTLRKRGLMQKLLNCDMDSHMPKKRLPGFRGEWKEVKLGEIAEIYQPVTIPSTDFTKKGYPVFGANGFIGYYSEYNHETPQVVLTCRGSSCGTINITSNKCWITGNAMVLNVDNYKNISKIFFYYLILNSSFSSIISGSGQPQIVRLPLLNYCISIPSFTEQTVIAQVLTAADSEIGLAKQKLDSLRQQKRGLMQVLLTGKKMVK